MSLWFDCDGLPAVQFRSSDHAALIAPVHLVVFGANVQFVSLNSSSDPAPAAVAVFTKPSWMFAPLTFTATAAPPTPRSCHCGLPAAPSCWSVTFVRNAPPPVIVKFAAAAATSETAFAAPAPKL